MKRVWLITYEQGICWIVEIRQSNIQDKCAIVLDDEDAVSEFFSEFKVPLQMPFMMIWRTSN